MNRQLTHGVSGSAPRRLPRRITRLAVLLAAPLALLDLQCRTDFRDAIVGGAYDFVSGKTIEVLEQFFAAFLDGGETEA